MTLAIRKVAYPCFRHWVRGSPLPTFWSPANWHNVAAAAHPVAMNWVHTAMFSCHPGRGRTPSLIRRYFWWDTVDEDARDYVAACTTCAYYKNSTQHRTGLLQPLVTPHWPWSQIALDFVTGLLVS